MSIYAIADLHLSFDVSKPMDIFGENWANHEEKIKSDWELKVKENDLVILPGDFSWATNLKETYKDFQYLEKLPGKKLLLKGNHDYWWTTLTSMRKYLKQNNFEKIDFIYNNSYFYNNYIITGTRGWTNLDKDEKILNRENIRLELSLQDGINKYGKDKEIIVVMHYPPFSSSKTDDTQLIKTMKKYNVTKCIYGHLHGQSHKEAVEGNINNIEYKLVSCDYTNFKLLKII